MYKFLGLAVLSLLAVHVLAAEFQQGPMRTSLRRRRQATKPVLKPRSLKGLA
jgi:hypothetical protein